MTAAPGLIEQIAGSERSFRAALESLDGGLNTRAYPHTLPDRFLSVADNAVFVRDGLVSKRPGNIYYGNSVNGKVGTGTPIMSLGRFYPPAGSPQLVVHSGTQLYTGTDATGAFTLINSGMTAANRAAFCQMYDPDLLVGGAAAPNTALFVCDGARIPQQWDGTNFVPVQTGGVFLPNGPDGQPIKPRYAVDWGYHMVYAGVDADPTALYISDALRPQRFTGISYIDSASSTYIPFYPAGRNGTLGKITGIVPISGDELIVFYTNGIVVVTNTGSVGAFEFKFTIRQRRIGCTAPYSIVPFEDYVVFFGGDRFYATNGMQTQPLPDRVPTIYSRNAQSAYPAEIYDTTQVVGVRHGTQYIASYTVDSTGATRRCAVFDTAASGGYIFGFFPRGYDESNGGAWSRWLGMNLNAAVECRGPGDVFQLYWGASDNDYCAQFDPPALATRSDFGAPITFEVRGKAFSMGKLYAPKLVEALYLEMVFDVLTSGAYTSTITPYIVCDQAVSDAPPLSVLVTPAGSLYGDPTYGDAIYESSEQVLQTTLKSYPQQPTQANSIAPGLVESSVNPCAIIGFAMEMTVDDPY